MTPDPAAAFAEARQWLEGRRVQFRRLAANSLLVYFECRPGDGHGFTVWLEPTWHLCTPQGVVAGSRQAQEQDDGLDPPSGFEEAARALDVLIGRRLESLDLDERAGDLSLRFDEGLTLRTFVSDPRDWELWHIQENATGQRVRGSPRGLEFRDRRESERDTGRCGGD